ncbi:MAG: CDP-alcohol phosphatidyltransferase family protein [Rhodospirillaceae bacterium]|nr:CDP-alcohol phosphatidyltransferase family protein [Rhodospirillaceae bacterium]MBT6858086.1 CDP-alcohol phosphatidyltransferase family protein [Rhodospirillaceae bacterium]MBT7568751.1 CDP-alcohol phosphatidyltransferase family protein [Rhodospirillaceae bacterium]
MAKTSVTPNQLTTLRLATGLGAAAVYGIGEAHWDYLASGLFAVSLILDRADGILARLSGKTSRFGHIYDLIADSACNALVFVGIGFSLRHGDLGGLGIPLGVIAGAAVLLVLLSVVRIEEQKGQGAAEIGNSFGFDPDDAMLFVPVAVLVGWSEGLILAASIGASLFAAVFILFHRRTLFTRAS